MEGARASATSPVGRRRQPAGQSAAAGPKLQRQRGLDARARFARLRPRWHSRTMINAKQPHLGSWLSDACRDGLWGVGCSLCAAAGYDTAWAEHRKRTNLQLVHLLRHAQTRMHQRAAQLAACESESSSVDAASCVDAPPAQEFIEVLTERKKGQSYRQSAAAGRAEKGLRMSWCLAEALRDKEREALKQSSVVSLHQDVRDSLLLVRFTAVGPSLKVCRGILGAVRDFGSLSSDVKAATLKVIEVACTPRFQPPRRHRGGPPQVDEKLQRHVLSSVELFDADGAADEQRAAQLLRAHLPNLKVVLRDKTHAATRRAPPCSIVLDLRT